MTHQILEIGRHDQQQPPASIDARSRCRIEGDLEEVCADGKILRVVPHFLTLF